MAQIRINLLPWREELKQEKKKEFFTLLGFTGASSVLILIILHIYMGAQISNQESVNAIIQAEITNFDKDIGEIKNLQEEKQKLLARMDIIQQLQSNRSNNVHIFDEVIRSVPSGLYLVDLELVGNKIIMNGKAESNTRVSRFMRNIEKTTWIKDPILSLLKAEDVKKDAAQKDEGQAENIAAKTDNTINFNLTATLWDQDRSLNEQPVEQPFVPGAAGNLTGPNQSSIPNAPTAQGS